MACSVQRFLGYNFKEKHRNLRGNSIILSPMPKTQLFFQQHAVAHIFTWPPVSGLRFALWCIMLHFPVQLIFVRPHNLVNLLTIFDKQECRHCTDFPCWCHIRHFININLEKDQAWIFLAQFYENRRHNAAWSTPGGCEIHNNNFLSILGFRNLQVPTSLGVHQMHKSMIPSHTC